MVALIMDSHNDEKFDENLPIINKTKHSTKGERKVQDERTPSPSKSKIPSKKVDR